MKIEYSLSARGSQDTRTKIIAPDRAAGTRPPRITCLLALAHHFEKLVRSGEVKDCADLARLGRVSRARISQILKLLTLAPSIQEQILSLPPRTGGTRSFTERDLRGVAGEPHWDRQRLLFEHLLRLKDIQADSNSIPPTEPPPCH